MEALGVISRVEEATPWCAGMVVVPKKEGALRICVDLKPLKVTVYSYTHAATIGMNIINISHKLVQSMFVVSPHPEPRPSI